MKGMFNACIATITAFLVTAVPRIWPGDFTRSPLLWILREGHFRDSIESLDDSLQKNPFFDAALNLFISRTGKHQSYCQRCKNYR